MTASTGYAGSDHPAGKNHPAGADHATGTGHRAVRQGPRVIFVAGISLVLLVVLVATTIFCGWVFLQRTARLYQDHVYPNVYALGVDLGGMSPGKAAAALEEVADQVDTGLLVLTDGEQRWAYPWSLAGLKVDTWGTAQAAYAVGHGGTWEDQLQVWLTYHDVPPRFLFDTTAARDLLSELDQEVSHPTVDPRIELRNGEVVLIPGQAGRVLDIPTTLARLREAGASASHQAGGNLYQLEVEMAFEIIPPLELETEQIQAQSEAFLAQQITVLAYEVLTDETLSWTLDRDEIATWLYLVPGPNGEPVVDVNRYAIQDTLVGLTQTLGDGRGFRYDQAAGKIFEAIETGESQVWLYLTHPERTYVVQSGDTLTSLSAKLGMPAGLVAEANPDIDVDRLYVGQEITIPSQDILTPNMPIPGKKVIVSLDDQRTRVYENGQLIYEYVVSTGLPSSPTHRGTFQVLEKLEEAYASQWDLWMPYFVAVYPAGGGIINGFHELPILSSGQRLWAGNLGRPASYGCIILGIPDAQTLYEWAEPGVTVVIQ